MIHALNIYGLVDASALLKHLRQPWRVIIFNLTLTIMIIIINKKINLHKLEKLKITKNITNTPKKILIINIIFTQCNYTAVSKEKHTKINTSTEKHVQIYTKSINNYFFLRHKVLK